jgi:subtilisin family serine protease
MRAASGKDDLGWDTRRPSDHNYLFVPNWLLVDADDADEARMVEVFEKRKNDLPMIPSPPERETPAGDDKPKIDKLDTYRLPARTGARRRDVLDVLRIYDDELGVGVVTPMHYVHVAGTGDGRACSATEPYPADRTRPWPEPEQDKSVGEGVKVVMIDTGWMKASGPTTRQLPPYAGHGLFAEAVLKSRAPRARIRRLEFPISSGGAVKETDLADLLTQALAMKPQVISMSAGCHTRHDRPLKSFERVWANVPNIDKDQVVVVTAAGNDASPSPFYPAASDWTWGVGSLDRDNKVSSFSNYRQSADVFILGRGHVNRFPRGTYVCQEPPHVGYSREFVRAWARWSGTSFAAPLLAGLIAAYISENTNVTPAQAAKDLIRSKRVWRNHPLYGDYRKIRFDQI